MLIHSHGGEDTILLVSNEVADALEQFVREGNNVALRRYRAKAYYSLDCGDGIEHHILFREEKHEISIEECRDEVDTVYRRLMNPIEESVESKLMWEGIKKYLHKLTPKECEVMISLYVEHLSVRETAAKLKVEDSTVSTHRKNACDKIRNAMEEQYYGEF